MKMDTQEFKIRTFTQRIGYFLQLPDIYTKFIFIKPRSYKVMRVGINVRVDADSNFSGFIFCFRQLIDYQQFLHRLHIKAKNIRVQRQIYLFVGLSHPGKNNILPAKTTLNSSFYFVAANTISTKAVILY